MGKAGERAPQRRRFLLALSIADEFFPSGGYVEKTPSAFPHQQEIIRRLALLRHYRFGVVMFSPLVVECFCNL